MTKKKVAFIVNNEYTWAFHAIKSLIIKLDSTYTIEGLILVPDKIGKKTSFDFGVWNLKIFGIFNTAIFVCYSIKQILKASFSDIKDWQSLSSNYKFEIINTDKANSKAIVNWIKRKKIDILFLHTNQIINKELLSAVRIGTINKHASVLPSCRGIFPFFWAKLSNSPIGLTFHQVTPEIDKGKVILQIAFRKYNKSLLSFYISIYSMFPHLAKISIDRLVNQTFIKTIEDVEDSYYSFPTRNDYLDFRKDNHKISVLSDIF